MTVVLGGLDDPRVIALLRHHVTTARAETGRRQCALLDRNSVFMTRDLAQTSEASRDS